MLLLSLMVKKIDYLKFTCSKDTNSVKKSATVKVASLSTYEITTSVLKGELGGLWEEERLTETNKLGFGWPG